MVAMSQPHLSWEHQYPALEKGGEVIILLWLIKEEINVNMRRKHSCDDVKI